jgi:hypothetical protein
MDVYISRLEYLMTLQDDYPNAFDYDDIGFILDDLYEIFEYLVVIKSNNLIYICHNLCFLFF